MDPRAVDFLMRSRYKRTDIGKLIVGYVQNCQICRRPGDDSKVDTRNRVIVADVPNELWEVAFLGPLKDKYGNQGHVYVAIDHHTKWI